MDHGNEVTGHLCVIEQSGSFIFVFNDSHRLLGKPFHLIYNIMMSQLYDNDFDVTLKSGLMACSICFFRLLWMDG